MMPLPEFQDHNTGFSLYYYSPMLCRLSTGLQGVCFVYGTRTLAALFFGWGCGLKGVASVGLLCPLSWSWCIGSSGASLLWPTMTFFLFFICPALAFSVGSDQTGLPSVPTGINEPWVQMILSPVYWYIVDKQCSCVTVMADQCIHLIYYYISNLSYQGELNLYFKSQAFTRL